MEIKEQPKLFFEGVDVTKVRFTSMRPSREKSINIHVGCKPRVFFPENDKMCFRIIMDIKLYAEEYFDLELRAIGNFRFGEVIADESLKKNFVNINAPAIMFPYVRSFVTTLTASSGNAVGALIIPPQFFDGPLEEIKIERTVQ